MLSSLLKKWKGKKCGRVMVISGFLNRGEAVSRIGVAVEARKGRTYMLEKVSGRG